MGKVEDRITHLPVNGIDPVTSPNPNKITTP